MTAAAGLAQPGLWPFLAPVALLFFSNLFMTFAWYGHLKYKAAALVLVIFASWGIAFVEYCFAVPATASAARSIRPPN